MRLIYENAEEVIVFLGDDRGHRLQHADLVNPPTFPPTRFLGDYRDESILARFLRTCQTANPQDSKSSASPAFYAMSLVRLFSDERMTGDFPWFCREVVKPREATGRHLFECLRSFLLCPWWKRIWVVQEIAVSKDAVVQFGNVSARWKVFVGAAKVISSKLGDPGLLAELDSDNLKVLQLFQNQLLDLEETRRRWYADRGTNLSRLLQQFSDRQASDDRDKVFGLLSLANQGCSIQPNYELNVQQTYINTLLDITNSDASLVCWAGDQKRKNRLGLPSWIPDWSNGLDVADKRRMAPAYVDKYNVNRGWKLQIIHKEVDYWASVKDKMELFIDSLVKQQRSLPLSLRSHVNTYMSHLYRAVGNETPQGTLPHDVTAWEERRLWTERTEKDKEPIRLAQKALLHQCERLEPVFSECLQQHVALAKLEACIIKAGAL